MSIKGEFLQLLKNDEEIQQEVIKIINNSKRKVNNNVDPAIKKLARGIFDYYNYLTGKNIRESGMKDLCVRLKNMKPNPIQIISLINYKYDEWWENEDMNKYFAPSTLFRASNCIKYWESARGTEFDVSKNSELTIEDIIDILNCQDRDKYNLLKVGLEDDYDNRIYDI